LNASNRVKAFLCVCNVSVSSFASGWLGALSACVSLFLSPLTVAVCNRKSTRLTAVMGGLVAALGFLFTSFASQFHQLFLSYGILVGKCCLPLPLRTTARNAEVGYLQVWAWAW
jgi:hypothetical protein